MLGACGADVILQSIRGGARLVKVRDFFLGYAQLLVLYSSLCLGRVLPVCLLPDMDTH